MEERPKYVYIKYEYSDNFNNFHIIPILLKFLNFTNFFEENQKKRKRVQSACTHCQKSHSSCDDERPCRRCISKGLEDQCKDGIRKRRGRKMKEDENQIEEKLIEPEFGFYVYNEGDLNLDSLKNSYEDHLIQFSPNICLEILKEIKKATTDDYYTNRKCLPSMFLYDNDYYNHRYDIYPDKFPHNVE